MAGSQKQARRNGFFRACGWGVWLGRNMGCPQGGLMMLSGRKQQVNLRFCANVAFFGPKSRYKFFFVGRHGAAAMGFSKS